MGCNAGYTPARPIEISLFETGLIEIGCNNMQAQLYSFPPSCQPSQLAFQGLSAQEGGI